MLTKTWTMIPDISAYDPVAFDPDHFQDLLDAILSVTASGVLTIQVDDDGYTVASNTTALSELPSERLDLIETLTYMEHRNDVRAALALGLTRTQASKLNQLAGCTRCGTEDVGRFYLPNCTDTCADCLHAEEKERSRDGALSTAECVESPTGVVYDDIPF